MESLRSRWWLVALLVVVSAVGAVQRVSAGPGYSAVILADNPLGYWRLGESDPSMPAADASPNGNNGTYVGGITLGMPGAIAGDPDTAAGFDGMTAIVDIPSGTGGTFDLSTNFSLEAWVINMGQRTGFPLGRIFSNGVPGSRGFGWGVLSDDRVRFTTYGIKDYDSGLTIVPEDGAWHYVVVTVGDGATANFYLDGLPTDSIAAQTPARSSEFDLLIGDNPSGVQEYWNGCIDEAAVYNTVLTDLQIAAHYAAAQ